MVQKNFYSVAKGRKPGIYKDWSSCELTINKFKNAVYKGFSAIDQAILFLFAGNSFSSCSAIPVFDSEGTAHSPVHYGHDCSGQSGTCNYESLKSSTPYVENSDSETEQTEVLKLVNNMNNENEKIHSNETDDIRQLNSDHDLNNNTGCTKNCKNNNDDNMICCSDCHRWTHYLCTKLPSYQLYTLINSKRKYSCEICSIVPGEFLSKWPDSIEPTKPTSVNVGVNTEETTHLSLNATQDKSTETSVCSANTTLTEKDTKIWLQKLETNLVAAVTETHKLYLEKDIDNLKTELNDERQKHSYLHDKVTKLSAEKSELLERCKNDAELNPLRKQLDDLKKTNTSIQGVINTLNQQNKKIITAMGDLDQSVTVLNESQSVKTQRRPSQDVQCQTINKLDTGTTKTNDTQARDLTYHTVSTSNRFTPFNALEENSHDANEKMNDSSYQGNHGNARKGKLVLIGNSHLKPIREKDFIYDYDTEKYIAFSFQEATHILQQIEGPVDCLVVHLFTNDIKEHSSTKCLDIVEKFITFIHDKWHKIPIIISDAIPRGDYSSINKRLQECNIHLRHKYIGNELISVCDNACIGIGGNAINKFISPDKIHLSTQGTKVLVANIKSSVREALCIPNPFKKKYESHVSDRTRQYNYRYSDQNREYSDVNREYSDTNRQYSDQNRQYSDRNRQYSDQNSQYSDPSRQYSDQNRQYSRYNSQNNNENEFYGGNSGYRNPYDNYGSNRQFNTRGRRGY
ncbi:probable DNA repair protein RAD50 [Mytilus edulis]|uniref:probable DNA repair protein RAD50 n=1 Tax=Mytilus edulis TaxID=6550 RepID=UPI0039F00656